MSRAIRESGPAVRFAAVAAAALVLVLGACNERKPSAPAPPVEGAWTFALKDANPTSPTYGFMVTPATYAGRPVVIFAGSSG